MKLNNSIEKKIFKLNSDNLIDTAISLTPEEINDIKNYLWDYHYVDGSESSPVELLIQYITYRLIYNIEYCEKNKTDELYKIWKELVCRIK